MDGDQTETGVVALEERHEIELRPPDTKERIPKLRGLATTPDVDLPVPLLVQRRRDRWRSKETGEVDPAAQAPTRYLQPAVRPCGPTRRASA